MVEAGSQQCHPSSVDFDTGADDPKNPRRYVVWCTNMNRHILPECVVSYKSPKNVLGISGSIFNFALIFIYEFHVFKLVLFTILSGQLRGSTKYPFAKLISQMKSSLPASKVQEAMTLYDNFRVSSGLLQLKRSSLDTVIRMMMQFSYKYMCCNRLERWPKMCL